MASRRSGLWSSVSSISRTFRAFGAGSGMVLCVCGVAGWAACTPVYLWEAGAAMTVQCCRTGRPPQWHVWANVIASCSGDTLVGRTTVHFYANY